MSPMKSIPCNNLLLLVTYKELHSLIGNKCSNAILNTVRVLIDSSRGNITELFACYRSSILSYSIKAFLFYYYVCFYLQSWALAVSFRRLRHRPYRYFKDKHALWPQMLKRKSQCVLIPKRLNITHVLSLGFCFSKCIKR